MQWLLQNWVWVLFSVAFIGMHLFCHTSHSGHGGSSDADKGSAAASNKDSQRSSRQSGHHH